MENKSSVFRVKREINDPLHIHFARCPQKNHLAPLRKDKMDQSLTHIIVEVFLEVVFTSNRGNKGGEDRSN
jgi:hypothetical protein